MASPRLARSKSTLAEDEAADASKRSSPSFARSKSLKIDEDARGVNESPVSSRSPRHARQLRSSDEKPDADEAIAARPAARLEAAQTTAQTHLATATTAIEAAVEGFQVAASSPSASQQPGVGPWQGDEGALAALGALHAAHTTLTARLNEVLAELAAKEQAAARAQYAAALTKRPRRAHTHPHNSPH
jgi:hypothetical protein